MKLSKKLVLSFVLFAAPTLARADVDHQKFIAAVTALTSELTPYVRPLGKDALSFHYEHTRDDGSSVVAMQSREIQQHMAVEMAPFFELDQSESLSYLGTGLYVAFDPIATAVFGGADFGLYTIPLTRQLMTFFSGETQPLTDGTKKLILEAGCQVTSLFTETIRAKSPRAAAATPACRELGLAVLKALNIDLLVYPYYGVALSGCNMNPSKGRAAIILNPKILNGKMSALSPKIPANDPNSSLRLEIEKINRSFAETGLSYSLWPELALGSSEHDTSWMMGNIFYCK